MKKKIKAWVTIKRKTGKYSGVYDTNISHFIDDSYICVPCTITYEVKKRKK